MYLENLLVCLPCLAAAEMEEKEGFKMQSMEREQFLSVVSAQILTNFLHPPCSLLFDNQPGLLKTLNRSFYICVLVTWTLNWKRSKS